MLQGTSYPQLPFPITPKTIVDIGANVGAASLYFAVKYPGAKIFAFEPSSTSFDLLLHNTAAFPKISCFPFGLHNENQMAVLFPGKIDSVTDSLVGSNLNSDEETEVELRAASDVVDELGLGTIDILKIDTEGNELPILESLALMIEKISVVYLEFHNADDRLEIDRMLDPTHLLFFGRVTSPHRGELCYAHRESIPEEAHELKIGCREESS